MVTTLLRLVGVDVKRLAREAAITIVLAMLGAFVAMLALTFGVVAIYLWLELKLGIFAALSILGGTSALLAGGRCLNAQKDQYFFEPWQGDVERERTARGAIQLGDDPHSPDVWQSAAPLGSPQP